MNTSNVFYLSICMYVSMYVCMYEAVISLSNIKYRLSTIDNELAKYQRSPTRIPLHLVVHSGGDQPVE